MRHQNSIDEDRDGCDHDNNSDPDSRDGDNDDNNCSIVHRNRHKPNHPVRATHRQRERERERGRESPHALREAFTIIKGVICCLSCCRCDCQVVAARWSWSFVSCCSEQYQKPHEPESDSVPYLLHEPNLGVTDPNAQGPDDDNKDSSNSSNNNSNKNHTPNKTKVKAMLFLTTMVDLPTEKELSRM